MHAKIANEPQGETVLASPDLMEALGLADGRLHNLHYGTSQSEAVLRLGHGLPAGELRFAPEVLERLWLDESVPLSAWTTGPGEIVLGPLIGVLIAHAKLQALLAGTRDTVFGRMTRYAREVGTALFFFSMQGLDFRTSTVHGFQCDERGAVWSDRRFPIPRVVYDRCFTSQGRAQAAELRDAARELGIVVVNNPTKITKLQAFSVLSEYTDLAHHLPHTERLTAKSLPNLLHGYADLYLKPNALSRGAGVYRMMRQGEGWMLWAPEHERDEGLELQSEGEVTSALEPFCNPAADYLAQEGLPLATYLGNRFDFRSLVQKDGAGHWRVTGLVARVAPVGGVITSPRAGGQVAVADRVLRHAFPDRWRTIIQEIERVSIKLAACTEKQFGICAELGLDLGVIRDGTVKLIEVNGKPLKVSLKRLGDPQASELMDRCPVHFASYLDLMGVGECIG